MGTVSRTNFALGFGNCEQTPFHLGTRRPLRLRVRFVEDEYEGFEDLVSPARRKVR